MEKNKLSEKSLFLQRFLAFIVDTLFVVLISSLISFPFVDNASIEKLNMEMQEVSENYINSEIDINTYLAEYSSVVYQLSRKNGVVSFITIFIEILYFIVYQLYNKGQTLGKKLLKIRVESVDDGELTMNQMIFRVIIINSILYGFVSFALSIFASQSTYFYGILIFELIQYLVLLISGLMIMFGKRGLHDLVSHTKVVRIN